MNINYIVYSIIMLLVFVTLVMLSTTYQHERIHSVICDHFMGNTTEFEVNLFSGHIKCELPTNIQIEDYRSYRELQLSLDITTVLVDFLLNLIPLMVMVIICTIYWRDKNMETKECFMCEEPLSDYELKTNSDWCNKCLATHYKNKVNV